MKIRFATAGARRPAAEPRAARAAKLAFKERAGEVTIVWTDRARLRVLNRRFRRTDRGTDVMAFLYAADPRFPGSPFGDIYIALDQARDNARRFGVTFEEEVVRLAAHGSLHLLGYSDYTLSARKRMWAAQEPIVHKAMGRRGKFRWRDTGRWAQAPGNPHPVGGSSASGAARRPGALRRDR